MDSPSTRGGGTLEFSRTLLAAFGGADGRHLYDLRHAALSLWLNATGAPAEVAAQADNSVRVPHDTHLHCLDSRQDLVSQRIEDALDVNVERETIVTLRKSERQYEPSAPPQTLSAYLHRHVTASGSAVGP